MEFRMFDRKALIAALTISASTASLPASAETASVPSNEEKREYESTREARPQAGSFADDLIEIIKGGVVIEHTPPCLISTKIK